MSQSPTPSKFVITVHTPAGDRFVSGPIYSETINDLVSTIGLDFTSLDVIDIKMDDGSKMVLPRELIQQSVFIVSPAGSSSLHRRLTLKRTVTVTLVLLTISTVIGTLLHFIPPT